MATNKRQITGMYGVFATAAELSKRGLTVSLTSRNAKGADLLVTDSICSRAWSVQVKANSATFSFFLLSKDCKDMRSTSHVYVLVNIRKDANEYFIVPSAVIADKMDITRAKTGNQDEWCSVYVKDIQEYKNKWELFTSI
jgi:hypothetical protein